MAKTLGYMLTLTTYGTWLQGKEKGFVKDGIVRGENIALARSNAKNMKGPAVRLNKREKVIVREAIVGKAKKIGQRILAISVQSNHVHIVAGYDGRPVEETVRRYKNTATVAMRDDGFHGRVWTKGYDKRYCFDVVSLKARVAYVEGHGDSGAGEPQPDEE